jgi:hypothetical protein
VKFLENWASPRAAPTRDSLSPASDYNPNTRRPVSLMGILQELETRIRNQDVRDFSGPLNVTVMAGVEFTDLPV